MKSQDPDLIVLQEVYSHRILQAFLQAFPDHHPVYQRRYAPYILWLTLPMVFCPSPWPCVPLALLFAWLFMRSTPSFEFLLGGVRGNLILSRIAPLQEGGTIFRRQTGIDRFHHRGCIWADIVWEGSLLSVCAFHLSLDVRLAEEQLEECMRHVGKRALLLGDTNAGRPIMEPLEAKHGLMWFETQPTWVSTNPLTRRWFRLPDHVSDVVLARGVEGKAETVSLHLSDHFPVIGSVWDPTSHSPLASPALLKKQTLGTRANKKDDSPRSGTSRGNLIS